MTTHIAQLFNSEAGYRSHIWLEGKRLIDAGFNIGDEYKLFWFSDRLLVTHANTIAIEGALKVETRKVNKQGKNPAIRITGKKVQKLFNGFLNVKATFSTGGIEIVGHEPVYARSIPKDVLTEEVA